jgi:uncharacterized protein (TIGR02145 family)
LDDPECTSLQFTPPGEGTFSILIDGLTENEVYFICAYATNSNGTAYGTDEVVSITAGSIFSGDCPELIIDPRDNQSYSVVQIGDQCWMAENLNYGAMVTGGTNTSGMEGVQKYCFNNNEANCNTYGALYQWNEIMQGSNQSVSNPSGVAGICPEGWHLPSFSEICQLTNEIGGTSHGGGKLKETGTQHWKKPNEGATNEYGFTSLGSGNYWIISGSFNNLKVSANYWSTTNFLYIPNPDISYAWSLNHSYHFGWNLHEYRNADESSLSVRCIKD